MSKYLLIPLMALCSQCVLGQSTILTGLSFPSANNSFLGKPDMPSLSAPIPFVGVDYYTGAAQISVPICQLASRQLTIPITVDYVDGRGVKQQEYASQVGLGWQLNAGGSISRVVRGFPDEKPNGYLGTGSEPGIIGIRILQSAPRWGVLAANTASATLPPSITGEMQCFLGFDNNNVPSTPTADGEPDLFYVKTPFFSFEFVFNAAGQPVFLNKSGYQILTTNFFNTPSPACNNPSFEVIDDQGNQFYFGSTTASTEQSTDSIYSKPTSFISTWYLDKIVTFNSRDIINLTYQASSINDYNYQYSWMEQIPAFTTTTQYRPNDHCPTQICIYYFLFFGRGRFFLFNCRPPGRSLRVYINLHGIEGL